MFEAAALFLFIRCEAALCSDGLLPFCYGTGLIMVEVVAEVDSSNACLQEEPQRTGSYYGCGKSFPVMHNLTHVRVF